MTVEPETLDIFHDKIKVGEAYNYNSIEIETDDECREMLESFRSNLKLTPEELNLIDVCLQTVNAKIDDDLNFGPGEFCLLANMAFNHPSHAREILACSKHFAECVDFMGDLPGDAFLRLYDSEKIFADLLAAGEQDSDDEESEEFTDEEE